MDKQFAWFLGHLLADGSITKPTYRKKGDESHLQWQIYHLDSNVLYKIKEILGTRANVMFYPPYSEISGPSARMRVYDRKDIVRNYANIKTQIPDIPDKFVRHFMRGLVDGDGTIHIRKDRNGSARFRMINAEKSVIDWFSSKLSELLHIPFKQPKFRPCDNIWYIEWEGLVARLITWFLYHGEIEDCVLDRKKEYYLEKFLKETPINGFDEFCKTLYLSMVDDKIVMKVPNYRSLDWIKRIKIILGFDNATPVPINKGKSKYFALHIPFNLVVNTQDGPYWD